MSSGNRALLLVRARSGPMHFVQNVAKARPEARYPTSVIASYSNAIFR